MGVGVLVGAASAIVIAAGMATLAIVLLVSARVEGHEGRHGFPHGDRVVVDLDRILPWLVVVGVIAVLLLGGVAWLAAHRAVGPLSEALRMQRSFVSDASHELRTPLTALSGRIQILQRRHERGQPIDATIAALRRDAATLDDVLTDMLLTAEGDSSDQERAEVSACISAAVETIRPLADEGAVSVSSWIEGEPVARMPTVTLTRLCVALLDNAVQHAPAGSQVTARAVRTDGTVEIRVADAGKGITAADAERVFERFARGEESGRRRGFGLGLALVRETAARYRGSVRIEASSPAGSTFLLTLPAE